MSQPFRVVIIGGGVMGSAIAYFLRCDPSWRGEVTVLEPDSGYRCAATPRSWGGIRQQFSTPENIAMSAFGVQFVRGAAEHLAVGDWQPALGFREQGYLFLASDAGLPTLQANCALQRQHGAATELLLPDALAHRFPWLRTEDLAGGGFGPRDEGWIDPHSLLQGLRRKAIALGAHYRPTAATGISHRHGRAVAVTTADGATLAADVVVNAAGPSAGAVAVLAGVELPVRPRKRMSYIFACREDLAHAPLTIDPLGVAFRPEGGQYLAIYSPPADQDPDCDDLDLDDHWFEELIWPTLAARVPAFEAIKLTGSWAGHYDYNTVDQNALIGEHPDLAAFYCCCGFSGHGLQQAPAAGRGMAELLVHGRFQTLDLTRFGLRRVFEHRPLAEVNVV